MGGAKEHRSHLNLKAEKDLPDAVLPSGDAASSFLPDPFSLYLTGELLHTETFCFLFSAFHLPACLWAIYPQRLCSKKYLQLLHTHRRTPDAKRKCLEQQ
jgi:hypothetical protein